MDTPLEPDLLVDDIPAPRRSLRVAFVTETYPPEVNGVANTTAKFVAGLHLRQHDVQLVRPRQTRSDEPGAVTGLHEVLLRGLPIPAYPQLRMGVPSKRSLVRLWSQRRPDVVHVATEGPLGWSAVEAARHLRLPVTSDFRTNFHAYSRHYGVGWLHRPIMAYLRKFHNRCACTMVPTELLRRELERLGFQRLVVVARGVDTVQFSPVWRDERLRASWGVRPDDLVVGCVGRLAPEKNLPVALAAFRAIQARLPRSRLILVGEGPLRAELQQACPEAILVGARRGADLAAHYASLDLLLFPSTTETFGNVTTEALASGVPTVAYDYAAAAQVIRSGVDGVLVPFGATDSYVAAAVELASDPPARLAMGLRARSCALGLGWDDVIGRFEAQLAAACGALAAGERGPMRRAIPVAV